MTSLEGQRIVVTGGTRGLGLGVVEALVERRAAVTVVARTPGPLAEVAQRLRVATIKGDVSEAGLADRVLAEVKPDVLVLNAGMTMVMAPLHEQTWETFTAPWDQEVKAGLFWMQAALKHMKRGRVLVTSSGAAMNGSPLSGGYAGAKRMLWLMADYAQQCAATLDRDVRFQTLVLRQLVGATGVGGTGVAGYARARGVTQEAVLAGFGAQITPRQYGDHIAEMLLDPRHLDARAFQIKGDVGLEPLA